MSTVERKKHVYAILIANFKNMLTYKTDQLKTKPTTSNATSTATDAIQTITDAKPTVMH